jgi:hypothetical protein
MQHVTIYSDRGELGLFEDGKGNLVWEMMTEYEPVRGMDGTTTVIAFSAKDRRKQRAELAQLARMLRGDTRRRV